SGGRHLLFQYQKSSNITINAGKIGKGLDVRGDGGYIIAPPSLHVSDDKYEWINRPDDTELAEASRWLIDLIVEPVAKKRTFSDAELKVEYKNPPAAVCEWADGVLEEKAKKAEEALDGGRNTQLNESSHAVGRELVGPGLYPREDAEARLVGAGRTSGLEVDETHATVKSGLDAGVADYLEEEQVFEKRAPTITLEALASIIDEADDVGALTGTILRQIATSGLPESQVHVALRKVSEKADVPISSLKRDVKAIHKTLSDQSSSPHMVAAQATVDAFGKDNTMHTADSVWMWGNGLWSRVNDRVVKRKIHEVATDIKLSGQTVNSIMDIFRTEVFKEDHRFDVDTEGINLLNGELHRDDDGQWHLLRHERSHYRTTQLPVAYDPGAKAPRFSQFLDEIFKGDEDADEKKQAVLEFIAYSLLATTHLEKFVILLGSGANGKSVLMNVVEALIGEDNVAAVQPSKFDRHFQRVKLHGALVNLVTELPAKELIADAPLKAITSGESMMAEYKGKDAFKFKPNCTCWFGSNHLPDTLDYSAALFRRAEIIKFNRKFDGGSRDVHLIDKLMDELPGILNMALNASAGLLKREAFTVVPSSEEIKREWRLQADHIAVFVEECFTFDPAEKTLNADVRDAYAGWVVSVGIRNSINPIKLKPRLEALGIPYKRTATARSYMGIKLKDSQCDEFKSANEAA
ncbi:MAG: bifunctional DNA primase/polymerase, partial [Magnetococcales bacterium]|nr:bifunctional DNA primase/polymerase [Magnetococcales bacterium]